MKLYRANIRETLVDTTEILTPKNCADLKAQNVAGVIRYLYNLSRPELNVILASGLACFFVNYSRKVGWTPSAADGAADGARDVKALQALGIPIGVHIAFDLEGPGGTADLVIEHVTAHAKTVVQSGYIQSLYMGEGPLISSAQAYALPYTTLYWQSCSLIRDAAGHDVVPACRYALVQLYPPDQMLAGVEVDYNTVQSDTKNRYPIGVAA